MSGSNPAFEVIDEMPVEPRRARVYEHGWQSWSPTTTYPITATSHRPADEGLGTMCYRPGVPPPAVGFQGEGLLAVDPGDGSPPRLYAAPDGRSVVPSIRASYADGRVVVAANGPVAASTETVGGWARGYAEACGVPALRTPPTVWCSWYHYQGEVTEADVEENLAAIEAGDLPIDVIQIDDGWQSEIGDWLTCSERWASLGRVAGRIHAAGRRVGIWVAPLLVGARSALARDRPQWLIRDGGGPVDMGHNWGQDLYGLDATDPGAQAHLREVFGTLVELGVDYLKLDFLYAGALDGDRYDGGSPLAAYRRGLAVIREAVGPATYLVGCGAPMLPSVGLVDAMRVSPDIGPTYEPAGGDASRPSQRAATLSTMGRAFAHGRLWVNDPDCLLVRPGVERRADWAATVERYGGLRASGDRIAVLDAWGLETTRRLLRSVPPPTPFPAAGTDPLAA
jgi:alpha-galactosidase